MLCYCTLLYPIRSIREIKKKLNLSFILTIEGVVINVQDFGVGIAKIHQKKIFERFYQVSELQKKGALGIGLYISSQIVKLHNGKISVESKKGHGSTFSIALPY